MEKLNYNDLIVKGDVALIELLSQYSHEIDEFNHSKTHLDIGILNENRDLIKRVCQDRKILEGESLSIKLHRDNSIQCYIDEYLPQILEINPDFLKINNLNLENVDQQIRDLYKDNKHLIQIYGDNEKAFQRIYYNFKLWFDHMASSMINHPNDKDFAHALGEIKTILEGKYPDAL